MHANETGRYMSNAYLINLSLFVFNRNTNMTGSLMPPFTRMEK